MDLQEAKNSYIERSRQILLATEKLSQDHYGIIDIFSKSKVSRAKLKLEKFYGWLKLYDEAYSENLTLNGALPDLNMRNAKLNIVEKSRSLLTSSLQSYEKELSNIESSINFKISTSIASLALLISVLSVLFT